MRKTRSMITFSMLTHALAIALLTVCIIILPNSGDKHETEKEEVIEVGNTAEKKTIVIEHSAVGSPPESGAANTKTVHQAIIINGEEKKVEDLNSLPTEVKDILRKHGVRIDQ